MFDLYSTFITHNFPYPRLYEKNVYRDPKTNDSCGIGNLDCTVYQ
jgi:hypothetical protein